MSGPSNVPEQTPRKLESTTCSIGRLLSLKQRRLQSTEDMANHTIKAASVMEFMDELLPSGSDIPPRPVQQTNPFQILEGADKLVEIEVMELFLRAVTDNNLCPAFVMCCSEARTDPLNLDSTRQKVDAAFFYPDDAPDNGCPCWPDQVLPAEFKNRKKGNVEDAFDDRRCAELESHASRRKKNRGQINSYSELIQLLQFRVFLFMLFIIGRRFRLLRWDRSGVIITESTDYFTFPEFLCEFLWRVSHSSRSALGFDTTATRLPLRPDLTNILDDILEVLRPHAVDYLPRLLPEKLPEGYVFQYIIDLFAESLSVKEWPRYRLSVVDSEGKTRPLLVGKPVFHMRGTTGHCTRGYVAYDLERRKLVWLKDTWRTWYAGVETEGDVLLRLNAAGVEAVPTVAYHGDVEDHVTLTAAWWERQHPRVEDASPIVSAPASCTPDSDATSSDSLADDCVSGEGATENAGSKRKRESSPSPPPPADPQFRADTPVRHRKHYRLVVDEVCLELKRFRDARQLVRVFSDCINAHYLAASSPNVDVHVLHRDITDANIMMYPKVIETDSGLRLVWAGMLIDWEMSKPILATALARQPGCTGTWQFTSVRLLVNSAQPVAVSDDMESFLFILIHYAVRYLTSTMRRDKDAAEFLDQCYDVYSLYEDRIIVGQYKATLINTGKLIFNHPVLGQEVGIYFHNPPLDKLIWGLLRYLKDYYRDARILSSLADIHPAGETPASPTPVAKRRKTSTRPADGEEGSLDAGVSGRSEDKSTLAVSLPLLSGRRLLPPRSPSPPPPPVVPQPPDHCEVMARFLEAVDSTAWAHQPAIADRVASARYKSPYQIVPVVPPGNVLSESELEKHLL